MKNQILTRYPSNPVLSCKDVPYDSVLVYNAGVARFNGKYVMMFRNDYDRTEADFADFRAGRTDKFPPVRINMGLAFSDDGVNWVVEPKPCFSIETDEILRVYDPRLTVIDGRCYMCFAVDTRHGVRGGIAVTDDFSEFEILHMTVPDNRNMVLFPEKINGRYVRLERPFPVYGREDSNEAFDIWLSDSPDLRSWGGHRLLLGAENVPFSNCKIGPGAPPVKTPKGWLTVFHAVKKVDYEITSWHSGWKKIYYGGIMLLDLDNPGKVVGMYNAPLLTPEKDYELEGLRGEVIFPGGMILEDSGEVKIYYGAADTVECLATAHVDDLLKLCGC
jgi:beta-1,4-mannooligosaccharide/beta-1,4-mannosyl-N-acetylglucosamine phosphorylase